MKRETKLTQREQEELSKIESHRAAAKEFASTEEMLRCDAEQTPVPPAVAERLSQSIQRLPKPAASWWRRLLGSQPR